MVDNEAAYWFLMMLGAKQDPFFDEWIQLNLKTFTFMGALLNSDAEPEVQLLFTGFSRRWDAGPLREADSCRQSQLQLPSGSPDHKGGRPSGHKHMVSRSGHLFTAEDGSTGTDETFQIQNMRNNGQNKPEFH